jgi:hypothetical protein
MTSFLHSKRDTVRCVMVLPSTSTTEKGWERTHVVTEWAGGGEGRGTKAFSRFT